MGKWRERALDDRAWRCPPGLDRAGRAAEQDRAAGTRDHRTVRLADRTALASVALRRKADGRRVYAYLRWSDHGKTIERYIGEVDRAGRADNLAQAWSIAARRRPVSGAAPAPADAAERTANDASPAPASWASSPAVRAVMRGNKGRDTRPELAIRSAVHALGLRYRVGVPPIPGTRRTADLVFPGPKIAIFVDGCFWHGCPEHHRPAKRNAEYWTAKIEGNITRDADTDKLLSLAGWRVVRVWEHEKPATAAARILAIVRDGS